MSNPSEDFAKELRNVDGDMIVDEKNILLLHITTNLRQGGALSPGRDENQLDTSTPL